MASRGRHVEGTDGSDAAFRQRVSDRYKDITAKKKLLQKLYYVTSLFWACAAAIAFVSYQDTGVPFFHPAAFLGALLPVVGHYGTKRQNALYLACFSFGCALFTGYILYMGIGRTMTVVQANGFKPYYGVVLAIGVLGSAAHIMCMITARSLIELMDNSKAAKKGR
eukprot:m.209412 g.209412  ORF g.209412 m.209412 type:complete len:166 (+) comp17140_c2_seq3:1309-1806(+)